VAAAKFLVAATKKIFVVPNFVALTKPFFFRVPESIFWSFREVTVGNFGFLISFFFIIYLCEIVPRKNLRKKNAYFLKF